MHECIIPSMNCTDCPRVKLKFVGRMPNPTIIKIQYLTSKSKEQTNYLVKKGVICQPPFQWTAAKTQPKLLFPTSIPTSK